MWCYKSDLSEVNVVLSGRTPARSQVPYCQFIFEQPEQTRQRARTHTHTRTYTHIHSDTDTRAETELDRPDSRQTHPAGPPRQRRVQGLLRASRGRAAPREPSGSCAEPGRLGEPQASRTRPCSSATQGARPGLGAGGGG